MDRGGVPRELVPRELLQGVAKLERRAFTEGYMAAVVGMELAVYQGIDAVAAFLRDAFADGPAPNCATIERRAGGGWANGP